MNLGVALARIALLEGERAKLAAEADRVKNLPDADKLRALTTITTSLADPRFAPLE